MEGEKNSVLDTTRRYTRLELSSGAVHPFQVYGTAFKEDRTENLTALALETGFVGLDSANYPTAYEEGQVGEAIQKALQLGVKRSDLFIQTKFTPAWAHAPGKIPYDTAQPLEAQVKESIEQSFQLLKIDYIDALFLHVPFDNDEDNLVAWRVMESYVPTRIGVLGVSNFALPAFQKLYEAAAIKPEIVQNRFQEDNGHDYEIREFLQKNGVIYQGFSLLKANSVARNSELVQRVATHFKVAKEVAFYLLFLGLGKVAIVNGTTSKEHMRVDLDKITSVLEDKQTLHDLVGYQKEFEKLLLQDVQ
ncbi:uncharacterized protein TRIVIDRAFT_52445 [Trichoderma virens Gv29-8]|uniref:NADP-dependent oxidoreductase domain-containing protein n=1 Tax=Hypocrea virens (strain Gv29-8 / FGSC 10586) TaxID=413071 RepID=G9MG50_HYPVG|nr:uncharacterized protein TRIVIDRAFT_52445 [Trichoderma virens Gv29-8]EHK26500.1 hypothetical protein TRIVIDRAFT_52445 [Trichoderma virens Gv29-8]UKZ46680.1 hypothetical protein TrVGV298_000887 [Trichoderma virens]